MLRDSDFEVGSIVANYNTDEETQRVVQKLLEESDIVAIVDNSSSKILESWSEKYPNIVYIDTGSNLGYPGALNIGLKELVEEVEYIFVANPDIIIEGSSPLKTLASAFSEYDELGIIGPVFSEGGHSTPLMYRVMEQVSALETPQTYDRPLRGTSGIIGAAMMIRCSLLDDIGFFDDDFFLYMEETEFCHRALQSGYGIAEHTGVRVHHNDSEEYSHTNPYQIYYHTRNQFLFANKRITGVWQRLFLINVFVILYRLFISRRLRLVIPWLEGIIDGLGGRKGPTRYLSSRS